MQTQTSNTLHNDIMEADSKDRPPMLAPDKEIPISEGSPVTRTESQMENYKTVSQDIRDQLNAEAESVQIILTGIDNDIYSTVDACSNACEMWKAIERLKQGESINVQDIETNLYWEFRKFTSQDGESSYYSRNRGKVIVNSPQPIYDQEPSIVAKDDETSKEKEIDKLMALISLSISNVDGARETVGSTVVHKSGIQCYNCKEFGHVARERQKPKQVKDAAYHREKMLLYQELEAYYMYMAQLQEVSPDAADSRPIFNDEPLQKVSNDDHYNVFAIESEHLEQSESVHDTYPIQQDAHNVIIDSLDMSYDREEIDQNDDDNDLANERELLASLIEELKCKIDESKNRNKFLETSNKVLVEKIKGLHKPYQGIIPFIKPVGPYLKIGENGHESGHFEACLVPMDERSLCVSVSDRYPGRRYVDGHVYIFDMVNIDLFTVVALNMMVVQLRYKVKSEPLYNNYLIPFTSLGEGLFALACEEDVCGMATILRSFKLIDVYIEHDVMVVDSYQRPPPRVRATIEYITEPGSSAAIQHRSEKCYC
nr:hypothetical protein [Tanacetum cinerariifolium]